MIIDKLEKNILDSLIETLKNYVNAWHKIPADLDVNHLIIHRVRYVKDWGLKTAPEDAFLIEFNSHKELLGRSELGLAVEAFKVLIKEQSDNGLLFGKDFVTHQEWYEHPVIYGRLDSTFDDIEHYEKDGKYEGSKYTDFVKKYD